MTYVQKSLALLPAKVSVGVAENETNGREEVTLARAIAADDDIVFGREGLDDRLVLVAVDEIDLVRRHLEDWSCRPMFHIPLEALNDNLLDIHLGETRDAMITGNNALRGQREGVSLAKYRTGSGRQNRAILPSRDQSWVGSVSREGQEDYSGTRGAKSARLVGRGVLPGGEMVIHRKKSGCGLSSPFFFLISTLNYKDEFL